jgi:23S rRNA (adenine2503-C2)-methyltransferase
MGFFRNLTAGEMIDQVRQVQKATGKRITNIVFMGMGEPMLNYEAVLKCAGIMASGLGIAARHITVSTAGWVDGIRRMGDDRRREKLAISLHSAVDQTRAKLMPIASRFPLDALMSAVEYYYRQTGQRVTYEFIFFEGINDTPQEVSSLVRLARRVPCKINVIPFHSIAFTEGAGLAKSLRPSPRMQEHVDRLRAAHLTVMVRSSAGEDIDAACGQLAVKIRRAGRRRSDLAHPAPQTI